MNDEILNEVEQIIEKANDDLRDNAGKELQERLVELEANIWAEKGASHLYELYILALEASSNEEAKEFTKDMSDKDVVRIGHSDSGEVNAVLSMKEILNSVHLGDEAGDLIQALANHKAAMYYSAYPNIAGYVFRTEAVGSPSSQHTGIAPSESDDKVDITVTGMITPQFLVSVVRQHDTNEVITSDIITLKDYNGDHGRLVDALIAFFVAPQILKKRDPELYEATLKDVMSQWDTDTAK